MAKKTAARKGGRKRGADKLARNQALPGTEQVRNPVLDNACQQIAQGRHYVKRGKKLEADQKPKVLKEMQAKNVPVYREAGVTVRLNKGHDTLSISVDKDE
jgi:hypothetical protein